MSQSSGSFHHSTVDSEAIRGAIRQVADNWGAEVSPEQDLQHQMEVHLPISAGLRIGNARLQIQLTENGSEAEWNLVSINYRFHRQALVILLLGASGGLASVFWPFFPGLLPFAAIGLVLAVSAWMLVGSRLRYRGLESFWQDVEDQLTDFADQPTV